MKILVLDDDKYCSDDLAQLLKRVGYKCDNVYSYDQAVERLHAKAYNIVVSDINMPGKNGLDLARYINHHLPKTEVILITGKADIIDSINAFEIGIYDFLTKPVDNIHLIEIIAQIREKLHKNKKYNIEDIDNLIKNRPDNAIINFDKVFVTQNPLITNKALNEIGIFSEKMTNIYKKLRKLHDHPDIPVLIEGETGTGKEAIAKYLHFEGKLQDAPFYAVNCSTLKKDMFEAELFGYEKGAFTGSDPNGKEGFLSLAKNGTLFLDEVTEIPLESQAKLLRLLQEHEFYRLGGTTLQKSNCRIVCATNIHIEELVEKRLFREDLYFRLTVSKIVIPPLRDRKEEIIPLTIFLLQQQLKKFGFEMTGIEAGALKRLREFRWFGNVRELKNYLMKLLIFNTGETVTTELISTNNATENVKKREDNNENRNKYDDELPKKILDVSDFILPSEPFDLNDHIMNIIKLTLDRFDGNKSKAAKFLNLKREQMYNRYKVKE